MQGNFTCLDFKDASERSLEAEDSFIEFFQREEERTGREEIK